eukprot:2336140-Rhodomonas_salina.1
MEHDTCGYQHWRWCADARRERGQRNLRGEIRVGGACDTRREGGECDTRREVGVIRVGRCVARIWRRDTRMEMCDTRMETCDTRREEGD